MRVWYSLAFAFSFILHGTAEAQTVEIRAGEHDTHTRLVLRFPEKIETSITYLTDEVELTLDRPGFEFAIDDVFARIPKTRLTGIETRTDRNSLAFVLACKCEVETFWFDGTALVVDIHDETDQSTSLFPDHEQAPVEETGSNVSSSNGRTFDKFQNPIVELNPSTNGGPGHVPGLGSVAFLISDAKDRMGKSAPPNKPSEDAISEHRKRVQESQDEIIRELGRAASQGLLSPRDDHPLPAPVPVPEAQEADAKAEPAIEAEDQTHSWTEHFSLTAETSMDQALSKSLELDALSLDPSGCLAKTRLDVTDWANGMDFNTQIGPLRSALVEEFDKPSSVAVIKLVKFYIHFGFGAEAYQAINLLPDGKAPDPVLKAMANVLEHGHDGKSSTLSGFMDCEPAVAVWSLLSHADVPSNAPIDPDAIVRGFLGLPQHLRAHLGPGVGQRLRQAGYPARADHVARSLLRNEATTTPAAGLLNAHSMTTGQSETALNEVIAANSEPSADALIQLIDVKIEQGDTISLELAELAGSYATEYRQQPLGQDLSKAYISALGAAGAFERAFQELDRLPGDDPSFRADMQSELMSLLTKRAPDSAFLRFAARQSQLTRSSLGEQVANLVSERLISIGFANAAEGYITPLASEPFETERKLLRARIALMQNRPRRAELHLIGVNTEDATKLRAKARSMVGEHRAAQAFFSQSGMTENAMRQAWLHEDWTALHDHVNPSIAALAENLSAQDTSSDSFGEGQVLARNTAMIEDSVSMRALIGALLNSTPDPDAIP